MDSTIMKLSLMMIIVVFGFSHLVQENFAEVICESLPTNLCSFAIASTGKRCSLGNYYMNKQEKLKTKCTITEVQPILHGGPYIESDKCMTACGVNRTSPILQLQVARLCSPACQHNCPNIIDFYDNLLATDAGSKGVNLTTLCSSENKQKLNLMVFEGGFLPEPCYGPVGEIEPPDNSITAPPHCSESSHSIRSGLGLP